MLQCAAVITHNLFIKEPPHKCWRCVVCIDTMFLIECGTGAYPPTIRPRPTSWPATHAQREINNSLGGI